MAAERTWDPRLDGYDWAHAFEVAGPPDAEGGGYNFPDLRASVVDSGVSLAPFQRADVEHIEALSEGENDGPDWLCVGRLRDGRWFLLRAGCDYTGWDCRSGGCVDVADSLAALVASGATAEERSRLGLS